MTSLDTRHFLSRFCLDLVDITQWYTQFLTFDRLVVNCVLKKICCAISKRNNFRLFHNSSVVFGHKTSLNPLFFFIEVPVPKPGKLAAYVCQGYRFFLFLRFFDWILDMFRQRFFPFLRFFDWILDMFRQSGIFVFHLS